MVLYTNISKEVKPKIAALKVLTPQHSCQLDHKTEDFYLHQVAESKLNVAMQKLAKAQGELDIVNEALRKMQSDFDAAMAKKQAIQNDADSTQKRMDSANKLISALGGEYTRWKTDSEAFADELRRMAGDVALACAFVSYAGPFNADFRSMLLDEKLYADCVAKRIPVTNGLSVTQFMVDDGTVGDWAHEGLPTDELSIQNGIMVTRSSKWPLLIDPQSQGVAWSE